MDKVLSVSVDQAGGTTATLIAAISGKKIEVVGFCLTVENGAFGVNSTLQDETANTVRFTFTSLSATSVVLYTHHLGDGQAIFSTAIGEGLELVTGTAAVIAGVINYRYV